MLRCLFGILFVDLTGTGHLEHYRKRQVVHLLFLHNVRPQWSGQVAPPGSFPSSKSYPKIPGLPAQHSPTLPAAISSPPPANRIHFQRYRPAAEGANAICGADPVGCFCSPAPSFPPPRTWRKRPKAPFADTRFGSGWCGRSLQGASLCRWLIPLFVFVAGWPGVTPTTMMPLRGARKPAVSLGRCLSVVSASRPPCDPASSMTRLA